MIFRALVACGWLMLLPVTGLFAQSASSTTTSCRLTGYVKGVGNQPIVFRYEQGGQPHADTVHAVHDRFSYQVQPSDDGQVSLVIDRSHWTNFWVEPGQLTATGVIAKPHQLLIKGAPENNLLTQYHQQIEWPAEEQRRQLRAAGQATTASQEHEREAALKFVRQHPAARTSADVLLNLTYWHAELVEEYARLYARFTPVVQASFQGREVAKRLPILRNMPVVGKPAPNFTIPDTAGVATTLASYRGKFVLLDFWGHWCGPCLQAMPRLTALHQQFGQRVTFVGVPAEAASEKPQWLRAIRQHHAAWPQLSELAGPEAPVLAAYNITAFPTYILLDPQGTVLERTSDLDQLARKLAKLF